MTSPQVLPLTSLCKGIIITVPAAGSFGAKDTVGRFVIEFVYIHCGETTFLVHVWHTYTDRIVETLVALHIKIIKNVTAFRTPAFQRG